MHSVPVVSPLLKLPIDMVQDVIVSDSAHLLHLGITKRFLEAYKNGHDGCPGCKWSKSDVEKMSIILNETKLPVEIHRAQRGLDVLSHWKASECAVFLNYVGISLLKHFLVDEHYINFVRLFAATTICSTDYFRRFLPVAHQLFKEFIQFFYSEFGSVTSNTHNLIHVVEECERFGPLPTISSYPFENHLFKIKKSLRSGRLPLAQIINRLGEMSSYKNNVIRNLNYPNLKYPMKDNESKFAYIEIREGLKLTTKFVNKWFLTRNTEIVAMNYADESGINGSRLIEIGNLFTDPLDSTEINVFQAKISSKNFDESKKYKVDEVLCKFVTTTMFEQTVFVPLHHTYPDNEQL